ncbi:MAG: aminotransferase class I/II-fold pyridoxal phosphate-dependent enzyme [Planctomycetes bacterium]|nr:aminotransferase class I/II-fold pyridoxal phosphate-dependent enzyme [Planctomycetota bacterium]
MQEDPMQRLSARGAKLAGASPMAPYILEHFARKVDAWDASDNAAGYIALCIAENHLMDDLLVPWLHRDAQPPARVLAYDAMVGAQPFREQLARFFERTFLGRRFGPEQIATLAGAGTVLEALFYAIGDPGDVVLVPTPSYAGFWTDLETRNALRIEPVPCSSEDGFALTIERLDRAHAHAGGRVRALLFTNPDNPLGRVASADDVRAIAHWAESRRIHVVFDEIYALSVFGECAFTSVARVREELGPYVHIVWAFSKDFGASGLRCGVLVSENEAVIRAVDSVAYWGAVSGHTQWMLGQMISDDDFVARYTHALHERLGETYRSVAEALDTVGIPVVPAGGGIFVLCDLRRFLETPSKEAEHALWRRLVDEAGVNLTPGGACRISEPGFFRLCYAGLPRPAVLAGIERVGRILRGAETR